MEASALIRREFWEGGEPVAMSGDPLPVGVPGLVYFRTSGSSGEPKWIGLSRRALQVSAEAVNRHLGVAAADCWALALPLEHVGGFGVAARSWQAGCRLEVFGRKWDAPEFAAWLGRVGATHLSLVPTQVHDLMAAGLRAPAGLRAVVVGGGVLAVATGRAARELGWPVLASYGMTEAASQVATQGLELLETPYVSEPLGLLPCWDARCDEDGRIALRGEALFDGMLVRDGDGWKYEERRGEWFVTSDRGVVVGRRLTMTGRADTRVKILGELVDPLGVEAELAERIDGGLVVLAVADERAGHRLVLVREAATDPEQVAAALAAYHAACPGFLRIGEVAVVAEIPRGPLGKPLRRELARIAGLRAN
jgi:O-succinylbenzoic acid--CoA ligase